MSETGMTTDRRDEELPERWSAQRKTEVVLRVVRGEAIDEVAREIQVPVHELEGWRRYQGVRYAFGGVRKDVARGLGALPGSILPAPRRCPDSPVDYGQLRPRDPSRAAPTWTTSLRLLVRAGTDRGEGASARLDVVTHT